MYTIYLCVFWIIGIWLASSLGIELPFWLMATAASLLSSAVFRRIDKRSSIWLANLFMLCAGGAWYIISLPQFDQQHIEKYNDNPRSVTITGIVIDEPTIRDRSIDLRVAVDTLTIRSAAYPDGKTETVTGKILVSALRFPEVPYGARIQVSGKLQTPFENREFSYRDYLLQEQITSSMYLPRLTILEEGQGNPFLAAIFAFKQRALATVDQIVPAPESGFLKAVLFGDKTGMSQTAQEDFRTTGVSHLIVVSGFHVAIVMLAILKFCDQFVSRRLSSVITFGILVAYALMVGGRPSVVRAVLMATMYLLADRWLNRPAYTVTLLALAAFLITLFNPQLLFNIGFQLSFAATLGVMLYTTRIEKWVKRQLLRFLSRAWVDGPLGTAITILAVSFAAQILTLPLIALYFEQLSLITLITNMLVIPVQPIVLILGAIATFAGMIFAPLGLLLGWVEWLFLTYTLRVVDLLATLPFASVTADLPHYLPVVKLQAPGFSVAVIYGVIALLTWFFFQDYEARRILQSKLAAKLPQRAVLIGGTLAALLAVSINMAQPDGQLHVEFFDVGQGDAVLITSPSGRQVLVDAGYYPSIIEAHLGRAMPFWDRSLDMLIATHPDADHVSGFPGILERYDVDTLTVSTRESDLSPYYDEVIEVATKNDVTIRRAAVGETIVLDDDVYLEVLHPGRTLDIDKRNNNSVSLRLVYGDFVVMLTGDAEVAAERDIIRTQLPLKSTILKAGHHGSNTSSLPEFLDRVQPQIAVVSAGVDNKFGHPHAEVMCRFHQRGISVLDTRCHGSIKVSTDGRSMAWWSHDPNPDASLSCNQPIDLAAVCGAQTNEIYQ